METVSGLVGGAKDAFLARRLSAAEFDTAELPPRISAEQIMKLAFLMALLAVGLGCAAKPQSGADVVRTCVADRIGVLTREWMRFESLSRQRVFFPDWRSQARQWARIECSRGHPVAAFHPSDTATARRYY